MLLTYFAVISLFILITRVSQRSFVLCFLIAVVLAEFLQAQSPQEIDQERSKRYEEKLQQLSNVRTGIRKQCNDIERRELNITNQLQSHWIQAITAQQALLNTPRYTTAPVLRNIASTSGTFGPKLMRGDPGALGIWYRLQDNSLVRNMLSVRALAEKGAAMQSLHALQVNRAALLDVANQADRSFQNIRQQADWLGRRSLTEHQAALEVAKTSMADDPRNAGMALVAACSLRSLGRMGESDDLLNEIDDYFLQLQVIHAMFQAQFDFANQNIERQNKILNEICPIAKEQGWPEPLLIRGWTSLADKEYNNARRWAYQAKEIAPENLEVGVLVAWLILEDTPKKAKDATQLLRDYGIRANPDDWFYQEALAYAFAHQSDWKQAQHVINYALATAPSHVHQQLLSAADDFANKKVNRINWTDRLRSTFVLVH